MACYTPLEHFRHWYQDYEELIDPNPNPSPIPNPKP